MDNDGYFEVEVIPMTGNARHEAMMEESYGTWFQSGRIVLVREPKMGDLGSSTLNYTLKDQELNCWVKKAHVQIVEEIIIGGE